MAAARHNLSRRAVLGAGVGACVAPVVGAAAAAAALGPAEPPNQLGLSLSKPPPSSGGAGKGKAGLRHAQPERLSCAAGEAEALHRHWRRTLAAYRRAEARVAAFKIEEALLPAARRAHPACEDLEARFGALDDRRFAALRRLLRLPAPDLAALALKLELAVADLAWEVAGAEDCLAHIAADARRLGGGGG